ncbi:MAG: hypothetical protein R2824_23935 [Saprospiraceae bacterium]|nr:hypothetical protein [Lewinella sp.]
MNTIYFDRFIGDDQRRDELYRGNLFVYQPTPATLALIEHAKSLIEEAFGDLEPTTAQHHLPVDEYVEILKALKPKFIHHPRSKKLLQRILLEMGCDPEQTYFDVPRMRSSTSNDYLTSGIAYAFHPHRDTWYSAPMCQINWWLPIYDVESGNVMAFHPAYFERPVKNGSKHYNYQEWQQTGRKEAAKHVNKDTREQPKPEEPLELDPQVRVVTPPGGMLLFSGAHLHSSVPNDTGKTRFSIDFRTVNLDCLNQDGGAPNMDTACTGTSMRDYLRVSDLSNIPEEIVDRYMAGPPRAPVLI